MNNTETPTTTYTPEELTSLNIRRMNAHVAGKGNLFGLYINGSRRLAEGTKAEMVAKKAEVEAR